MYDAMIIGGGVHIVAPEFGETITEARMVLTCAATAEDVARTITYTRHVGSPAAGGDGLWRLGNASLGGRALQSTNLR